MTRQEHIEGCVLGTAVGDALGLPREGLSRSRAAAWFGQHSPRHALVAGRGLCSDDTEHTVMVAQALIASGGEPAEFARQLARRLRFWLLRLPAGVGLGTMRACVKLWLGFGPNRSGVASAGNGPAMRSALLGLVARDDAHLGQLVQASTRLTHTDPRALQGAHVVAALARQIAAAQGRTLSADEVKARVLPLVDDAAFREALTWSLDAGARQLDTQAFAAPLGLQRGISGFVVHTVAACVYAWFAHQGDYRATLAAALEMGGDSDTVGAICGALAGTQVGPAGIPHDWLAGLAEWPCTTAWLASLAQTLAQGQPGRPPRVSSLALLLRNVVFLAIVLAHGFRRLLPPY
jgi:ADP-ribosylglycohydrolase